MASVGTQQRQLERTLLAGADQQTWMVHKTEAEAVQLGHCGRINSRVVIAVGVGAAISICASICLGFGGRLHRAAAGCSAVLTASDGTVCITGIRIERQRSATGMRWQPEQVWITYLAAAKSWLSVIGEAHPGSLSG